MKKINQISTIVLGFAFVFGLAGPATTLAATDPSLGAAATFSIVAQTAITGVGTISGNVGLNSTGAGITALTSAMVSGTIYSTDGIAPGLAILNPAVQANLSTANGNISGQSSDGSIGPVLDGLTITPGVYDIGAGRLNGGILTLDGPGVYILRASSDLISTGSINFINGARACDVYWQVGTLATINGSSFAGTIIAGTGVHFGDGVALDGRALALGGDVTLLNNTISGPTCVAPLPAPELTVTKTVINDNGGTNVIADFPLFLDGGSVVSGVPNTSTVGAHTVSETANANYTAVIGGDCAADGTITLALGDIKTCTITNNDIAPSGGGGGSSDHPIVPLIHVTKVPNPSELATAGDIVTYTNKVTNPGTEPLSNVQLTDDKCGPVNYISGDTNNDSKLDTTETWTYTCRTRLTATTVNTVTARGEANGLVARDHAIATVVVSAAAPTLDTVVPKLPNTGLHTDENSIPWYGIIPSGIFGILVLFYFVRRKRVT
jgi:type VI secretion system secreted protein VgrG